MSAAAGGGAAAAAAPAAAGGSAEESPNGDGFGAFLLDKVMGAVRKKKVDTSAPPEHIDAPVADNPKLLAVVARVTPPRSRSASSGATLDPKVRAQQVVANCARHWLEWLRARMVLGPRSPYHELGLNMTFGLRESARYTASIMPPAPVAAGASNTPPATPSPRPTPGCAMSALAAAAAAASAAGAGATSTGPTTTAAANGSTPQSSPRAGSPSVGALSPGVNVARAACPPPSGSAAAAVAASQSPRGRPSMDFGAAAAAAAAASTSAADTKRSSSIGSTSTPPPRSAVAIQRGERPRSVEVGPAPAATAAAANGHDTSVNVASAFSPMSPNSPAPHSLLRSTTAGTTGSPKRAALPLPTSPPAIVLPSAGSSPAITPVGTPRRGSMASAVPTCISPHPLLPPLVPADFLEVLRFDCPRDAECVRMEVVHHKKQKRLRAAHQREAAALAAALNSAAAASQPSLPPISAAAAAAPAPTSAASSSNSPVLSGGQPLPPAVADQIRAQLQPVAVGSRNNSGNASSNRATSPNTLVPVPIGSRSSSANRKIDPLRNETPSERAARELAEAKAVGVHTRFEFECFAPKAFANLRTHCGLTADGYAQAVADATKPLRSFKSFSKGGSFFFFSADRAFLFKSLTAAEFELLLAMLPQLYTHWTRYPFSLLGKTLGLYRAQARNVRHYFVVLPNAFHPPTPETLLLNRPAAGRIVDRPLRLWRKFDLKGSSIDRLCSKKERQLLSPLLKDNDLGSLLLRCGQTEGPISRALLGEQLRADVALLQGLNIMDYSLVLGVFRPEPEQPAALATAEVAAAAAGAGTAAGAATAAAPAAEAKTAVTAATGHDRSQWSRLCVAFEAAPVTSKQIAFFGVGDGAVDGEVYSLAIIDQLQPYNMGKKLETLFKGIFVDKTKLSSVDAPTYARRFMAFVDAHLV